MLSGQNTNTDEPEVSLHLLWPAVWLLFLVLNVTKTVTKMLSSAIGAAAKRACSTEANAVIKHQT